MRLFSLPLGSVVEKEYDGLVCAWGRGGDTKNLLKSITRGIPACDQHPTLHPEPEPADRGMAGTTTSWALAPKPQSSWGCWAQMCVVAVLPHPSLSGSSTSFCSPNSPSPTDAWWGPFPTIFHSLWTLLSTRTAPLQPNFETLLKQLSQPCFAVPKVKKMVRGKKFSKLLYDYLWLRTLHRKEEKQPEILFCLVKRALEAAGY